VIDKVSLDTAVILAGGLGSRLRSAISDVPKPMAPINGRPFLEYQMDFYIKQGIRHFVLSVGYKHETISSYFGTQYQLASIEYVVEDFQMGTGGGLLLSLKKLSRTKPFLLLNGDTFFDISIHDLFSFHQTAGAALTFALFRSSEMGRYMGINLSEDGRILSIREDKNSAEVLVNGGVYILDPKALDDFQVPKNSALSLEADIFPKLLKSEVELWGFESNGLFIDIGVPEDYYRAQEMNVFKNNKMIK
jgi:D-glycero-alpha-D-manno-heptose 1-phosphate guanylyltransferase